MRFFQRNIHNLASSRHISHAMLIAHMQATHIIPPFLFSERQGKCFGVAKQAALTHLTHSPTYFDTVCMQIEKAKNPWQLSSTALNTLKQIEKYQNPKRYGIDLPTYTTDKETNFLVKKVLNTALAMSFTEIELFVDAFYAAVTQTNRPMSATLLISGGTHTVMMGYCPKRNQFCTADVNHLPIKWLNSKDDLDQFFAVTIANFGPLIFSITCYTKPEDANIYRAAFRAMKRSENWRFIREISPERIELRDDNNHSWLSIAAFSNDLKTTKALLRADANPNEETETHNNPLIQACYHYNAPMVSLLVDHGANPDLPCDNGFTAWQHLLLFSHAGKLVSTKTYANKQTHDFAHRLIQPVCNALNKFNSKPYTPPPGKLAN